MECVTLKNNILKTGISIIRLNAKGPTVCSMFDTTYSEILSTGIGTQVEYHPLCLIQLNGHTVSSVSCFTIIYQF